VVTAHYSDNTTETVDGSLTHNGSAVTNGSTAITASAGTKTVTVSYGGKTTTFSITVNNAAAAIPLTNNIWTTGTLTAGVAANYYSFTVSSGTVYYIEWDDFFNGSDTYTVDIKVSASYADNTVIFTEIDTSYNSPRSFTASKSGVVTIKAEAFSFGTTGTYAIRYYTAPNAPTGVMATAQSNGSIKIEWNPVNGATEYVVFCSDAPNGEYEWLGHDFLTETVLYDFPQPGYTWYYKVLAYNNSSGAESPLSNYASATAYSTLAAPTGVRATAQSDGSIKVEWNPVNGAAGYFVFRSDAPYSGYESLEHDLLTGGITVYVDYDVAPGQTWNYKVIAYNNSFDVGPFSDYAFATVYSTTLAAPTGVRATAQSDGSIKIEWNPVNGAVGYEVCFSNKPNGEYVFLEHGSLTGTVFVDYFEPGAYYFKVIAYNYSAESPFSNYVSATVW
jgi:hypothetical protein